MSTFDNNTIDESIEAMDFSDLSLAEVPVQIGDKQYTLREATGDAACLYRNALLRCTKLGPQGKPETVQGMADVEPYLVSLCLFDENDKPVKASVIRKWPARIQASLFTRIKEISDLGDEGEGEEAAKNEPEGMTDGSD